jgi:hypothetical protein
MFAHLLSAPARNSTLSARCLSATLLAVAAGAAHAATLEPSTDFHVTVNIASSDQTFPAGYYGEITVADLLAQDASASGDGIALTNLPSGLGGTWYYSSYDANNVLSWIALSYTSVSAALVLPKQTAAGSAYSLRFVPSYAGFNNTTAFASPLEALTFVSCDGQPAEQSIDTTQNQAVSLSSGAIHLNRAPAIKTTSNASVSVDQTNGIIQKISLTTAAAGLTIDNLINDDDALAYYGIAVTGTSQGSNGAGEIGAWHFTYTNSDGISSDQDLTSLNDGTALLAGSTYRSGTSYPVGTLSFLFNNSVPETIDPDNPPAITYYAWDMTDSGTSYGDIVYVSPGNAITLPSLTPAGAYSLTSAQVVIALNHAPAATSGALTATCNSVTFTSNTDGTTVVPLMGAAISTPVNTIATAAPTITRAIPAPVQLTVGDLIISAGASDADSNTLGILVTSAASSGLFYSIDGGNTLTQIADGTYLTADALLYVQPAMVGSQTSNLTFQIWDQTDGAISGGSYLTNHEILPTGGGITAFSSTAVSVSISFDAIPSVTVSPPSGTLFSTTVGATPSWQVFGSSSYSNDSLTLAQTPNITLPAWFGTLSTTTGTGAITASLSAAQAIAPSDAGEDFTVDYAMSDGTASDVALTYEFAVAPYFTSDGTTAYDPAQAVTTAARVGSNYQSELLTIRIQPGHSLSALSLVTQNALAQAAQTLTTTTTPAAWSSLTVSYDTLTANDQGLVFFRITGTPTSEGSSTVVVNAEFLAANQTAISSSQTFTITVGALPSLMVSPPTGTLLSTTVGATPTWQISGSSSYSDDSLTLAQTSHTTLPAWLGAFGTTTGTGTITAYLSAAQAVAPSDAGEDFTVTYAMSDGTASDVALAYEFVVAPYFTSDGTTAYDPIQAVTTAAQVGSSYQSELLAIRIQPGHSLSALSVFDGIAQAAQTLTTTTTPAAWSSLTVSYDTLTANDQGLVFFRITGTPTSEGSSTVVVNAEFLAANQTAVSSSQTFTIIVDPLTSVLTLTGTHSIGAIVGHPLSLTVHASTSLAQVIPSISLGDAILPAGLTLTDNGDGSATIAGTPTEASAPRSIILTATDGVSTTSASFQLVISASPASVTKPTLPVATGNATPSYATVGLATPEAVDSFLAAIAGKDNTQVRAFAYSATAQQYVELPSQPAEGLLNHALFVVTRIDLPFSLDGTPLPLPTSLTLQPGWNFLTIPAITTDGSDTVTSHPWSNFVLTDADGIVISNPIDAIGTVGSTDLATTQPYAWTGSSYVHTDVLTSGVGYWFKNNTATALQLTRQNTTGNLAAASLAMQAMRSTTLATSTAATVVDRGTPPNPPSESSASSADSGSSSGCGLGSGVAGFGLLLLAGLRAALRRATAGRSTRP